MKKVIVLAVFFAFIVALGLLLFFFISPLPLLSPTVDNGDVFVEIDGVMISVEVARTDEELTRGLSGRESLEPNSGMLFVFDSPYIYSFWIPDMNFPIDIIWINDGAVVDISENVPNDFDPNNPVTYSPSEPAQYVLEVNAGFTENNEITIGDEVNIDL